MADWGAARARLPEGGVCWVLLDVDGTIRERTGRISDVVRRTIQEVQAAGVPVSIATGRRYPAARPIADDLGLTGPVICYQGAAVRRAGTGELLFHQPLEFDDARAIITAARELGLDTAVNVNDRTYTEATGSNPYFERIDPPATRVRDLLDWLTEPPTTISVVSKSAETRSVTRYFQERFGDRVYISTGHPLLTDISHRLASKARAVETVARQLGIPIEAIVAIGDDWNDIELLRFAGLGVAMGNAEPEVRAAADLIAPPIEEDGAAVALRELILSA